MDLKRRSQYAEDPEFAVTGDDFPMPDISQEYGEINSSASESPRRKSKSSQFSRFLKIASAALVVVITTSAMGRDILLEDPFSDHGHIAYHDTMPAETLPVSEPTLPPTEAPTEPFSTAAPAPTDNMPSSSEETTTSPTFSETQAPSTEESTAVIYDDAFPSLINPWPNGYSSDKWTNTYEFINDYLEKPVPDENNHYLEPGAEYLIMGNAETGTLPLHVGVNRTAEFSDIVDLSDQGAVYDPETNTLTLNNFHPEGEDYALEANMMGNNFTLVLHGENRLSRITMWGWYFGGSLTITGNGSLVVNEKQTSGVGLYFRSEYSQSCLMIDRNVTLTLYGSPDIENSAALYFYATTEPQGLYYLKPQIMDGGTLTTLQNAELSMGSVYVFGIMDEDGNHSLNVSFHPES